MAKATISEPKVTLTLTASEAGGLLHLLGMGTSARAARSLGVEQVHRALSALQLEAYRSHCSFETNADVRDGG